MAPTAALNNEVRICQLKAGAHNDTDIQLTRLSQEGCFIGAYTLPAPPLGPHCAGMWLPQRKRLTVFQRLAHTLNYRPARWRVLRPLAISPMIF